MKKKLLFGVIFAVLIFVAVLILFLGRPEAVDPQHAAYREEIQAALKEHGLDPSIAPSWYPEGYTLESVQVIDLDSGTILHAWMSKEDDGLGFQYTCADDPALIDSYHLEKDECPPIVRESNGRTFHIIHNANSLTATWSDGLDMILIYGPLSIEDMEKIIDAIGG